MIFHGCNDFHINIIQCLYFEPYIYLCYVFTVNELFPNRSLNKFFIKKNPLAIRGAFQTCIRFLVENCSKKKPKTKQQGGWVSAPIPLHRFLIYIYTNTTFILIDTREN